MRMDAPTLLSPRLTVGPFEESDAPALFRYRSNPEVFRFQSWAPESARDALSFIEGLQAVEFGSPETWFQLAIRKRACGTLVGDIGLHFLSAGTRQVEIGFTVIRPQQRQGFAREAVETVLDHLFGSMAKHRALASVDPRNEPSMALLEKLGFRQEAHFIKSMWFKGEWVDDVVFAILENEWSTHVKAGQ